MMNNIPYTFPTTVKKKSKTNVWDSGLKFIKNCDNVDTNFVVYLTPLVKAKISKLMKIFPNIEWLCYLVGEINWEKDYAKCTDLVIPNNQNITTVTVNDIDKDANIKTIGVIHSHHNMQARFSSIDNEYINKNNDISIVVSHTDHDIVLRKKTKCGCYIHIKPTLKVDYNDLYDLTDFEKTVKEKIKSPKHSEFDNIVQNSYSKHFKKFINDEIKNNNFLGNCEMDDKCFQENYEMLNEEEIEEAYIRDYEFDDGEVEEFDDGEVEEFDDGEVEEFDVFSYYQKDDPSLVCIEGKYYKI